MWSGQITVVGKVVANGLQPIEVFRSTRLQNQVILLYTHTLCLAIPYRGRPLSLPRSFSVRGTKLEAIYPEHCKQSQFDTWLVKRDLHHCAQKVKDQAYKSLVGPTLKYSCTVWDPYRAYQKSWLEQFQRGAARFVTRTYTKEKGCESKALKQLNWPTLEKRRQVARLTLMYKCVTTRPLLIWYVHHQSFLKTRASHPLKSITPQPSCDTYKYSFRPGTIINWNNLPSNYLTMDSNPPSLTTLWCLPMGGSKRGWIG